MYGCADDQVDERRAAQPPGHLPGAGLVDHMSGVSMAKGVSMPSDSAPAKAWSVSLRQSG